MMTRGPTPTPSVQPRETPDIETGSESYARRFAGPAGRYLLAEQDAAVGAVLADWRGGTVLDVGGGHAQLTPLLLERANAVVVLGSDARSLDRVRRAHPSCATAIGDLLSLPFPTRSFDLVVSVRLLPHVRDWPRLVAELCRVARRTVVVDYPRSVGFNALTPMMFSLKKRLEGNTRYYRNFRDMELDEVLRTVGFAPRQRRAQFVFPMVMHRQLNGTAALRALERIARPLHLTAVLGSPVVLRARRPPRRMTMRVLVVAPQPFYQERGTPIATRCLIEALRAAHHQVDVLTYHLGEDLKIPGVRVFRTPALPFVRDVPIGFSLRKLLCDLLIGWRLLALARRNGYDVLHAVEEAVFLGLLVRIVTGTRIVYDMDSSLPEQLLGRYRGLRALSGLLTGLERLAIARSDLVLAVCEDLAKHARGYETETPVDVLEDVSLLSDEPGGGEVENLRRSLPQRGLLAVYVGNLERYQGVRQMLEALAAMPLTGVPFKFVAIGGTEQDVASYRARAAALGIADRATFLGARPLADLGAYLAQADILVSPRLSGQNTPMKLYSYLAAGKAVLATRIPAHTQVLTDDCALLVEPEAAELGRGLRALLKDPVLRLRLGVAARRLAAASYSVEQFRDSVASAYRRLEPAPQSAVHELT